MSDTSWGEAPYDWEKPVWEKCSRVHDWKNYISERVQEMWDSFTSEQKVAIANQADQQAMREEWD